MKPVSMVLLALAVAAGIFIWLQQNGGSHLDTVSEAAGKPAGPSAMDGIPASKGPLAGQPPSSATIQTVPFSPPKKAVPVLDGMRVRVVNEATGQPVAHAVVGYLDALKMDEAAFFSGNITLNDIEKIVDLYGVKFQADAHGNLRVPRPSTNAILCSQMEGALGTCSLKPTQDEPVLLKLSTLTFRKIQVVDGSGDPQPGVPVVVSRKSGSFQMVLWRGVTSDPEGLASLRDPRFIEVLMGGGERARPGFQRSSYVASLGFPLQLAPTVSLTEHPSREDPLRLELPKTAHLTVELEDAGHVPYTKPMWVTLASGTSLSLMGVGAASTMLDPGSLKKELRGGRGSFPFVGLGLSLRLTTQDPASLLETVSQHLQGPKRPGEDMQVKLTLKGLAPALVGRVLLAGGRPAAHLHLLVLGLPRKWFPGFMLGEPSLVTDAKGRFRLRVGAAAKRDSSGATLILTTRQNRFGPSMGREQEARKTVVGLLRPGPNELGDLQLEPRPALVAGRVTDEEGHPVPEAEISVRGFAGHTARSDPQGRFFLSGPQSGGDLELTVSRHGFLTRKFSAQVGDKGLTLVLSPGGGLKGSVLLSADALGAGLVIKAGNQATYPLADLSFSLKDLPPGPTTVSFYLRGDREPLVSRPGVMVVAGQLRQDPQLAHVDLSGLIHTFLVEVVDRQARSLSKTTIWKLDAEGQPRLSVPTNAKGLASLFDRTAALKVRIIHAGHQTREVVLTEGRNRIVLENSLILHLVLAHGSATPTGSFMLMPLLRRYDQKGHVDTTGAMFSMGLMRHPFTPDWQVDLPLPGAGTYELYLQMVQTSVNSSFAHLKTPEPVKIQVTNQTGRRTISVRITPSALQEALQHLHQ